MVVANGFSAKQLMIWVIWTALAGIFSFTTWTATKVVALEKQTFAYQQGAIREQQGLEVRFDEHCETAEVRAEKFEDKLDKTHDAVLRIETILNAPIR